MAPLLPLLLQLQLRSLASAGPAAVEIDVHWGAPLRDQTTTAATINVGVMPFLGRTDYGGPFNAYYEALSNLGSEYVRNGPWFPNPRVVVTELTPSDCTATKPATNWNSTLFDGVMSDFMAAVCGPNAAAGACKLGVVQQLCTWPSWMFEDGFKGELPPAWHTEDPFDYYSKGSQLVDRTCGQMARYLGRIVGWYTNGGFHDECGHWHPSGLKYNWFGLSVLNEDEHNLAPDQGQMYTKCFDAIKAEVAKNNPSIISVGPELCWICTKDPRSYMKYFLNASNHADGVAPPITSHHHGVFWPEGEWRGETFSGPTAVFQQWDAFYESNVLLLEQWKAELSSETEFVLNEFIPFVNDWCDCTGVEHLCENQTLPDKCPSWQKPSSAGGDPNLQHAKGIGINRQTLGWNAAAASFAYGYGTLATLGYKFVGQDQLIGGTWPDNEPAVSCMDWQTGQVNAKYWVTNLLARTVGTKETKSILDCTVDGQPHGNSSTAYVMPYEMDTPESPRGILVINKLGTDATFMIKGASGGLASCVDGTGAGEDGPGFAPPIVKPISSSGKLTLGPYGVAVVTQLLGAQHSKL